MSAFENGSDKRLSASKNSVDHTGHYSNRYQEKRDWGAFVDVLASDLDGIRELAVLMGG